METKKLFYHDCYKSQFTATVVGCSVGKSGFDIILNETYFYPEGGGQPSDIGQIGDATVLQVSEKNGVLVHVTDSAIEVNTVVECSINWEYRFSLMQHHTGEHIVSGIIHSLFGYQNVGFHMGEDYITIDTSHELTAEQLERVEILANQAIYKNVSVLCEYPSAQELETLAYRSKKALTGDVRIVSVQNYDCCACCGLHCNQTGEVGLIKFIEAQRYKSGTRIYILCGEKALKDYSNKNKNAYELSGLLSVKPTEIGTATKRLIDENSSLKTQLQELRLEKIKNIVNDMKCDTQKICLFLDVPPDDLRMLCTLAIEKAEVVAVFSNCGTDMYKYAIGSRTLDIRNISAALNEKYSGRGGGKKELVQGSVNASREQLESFINDYSFPQ